MQPAKTIEGNPILIFNEDCVWYPLMKRDDTDKSQLLNYLVKQYATNIKEPELTGLEKELLERLIRVTSLETEKSLAFASTISSLFDWGWVDRIPNNFRQKLQQLGISPWLPWRAWMDKSNLLSPVSAYLAAVAKINKDRFDVNALCAEYLKYTKTPGYMYAHGDVWQNGLHNGGTEHSYRTHAGHCVVQSANISAALQLLKIDYYRLSGFMIPDESTFNHHDFIYVPEADLIISNARPCTLSGKVGGTVVDIGERTELAFKYLTFIEKDGKWAGGQQFFPTYTGTMSPQTTLEILTYLKRIHGDDIQTARITRLGTDEWKGQLEVRTFQQLRQYLIEQKNWAPYALP